MAKRTDNMRARWEEEGLPPPHAASLLAKICEPETSASDRATFFALLAQFSAPAGTTPTGAYIAPIDSKVAFLGVIKAGDKRKSEEYAAGGGSCLYHALAAQYVPHITTPPESVGLPGTTAPPKTKRGKTG